MDTICLTGLEFFGYHGCLPEERVNGQPFIVDLVLELPLERAGKTDDLTQTVNYAEVYEVTKRVVEGKPLNLIEAVAERIAEEVLTGFPKIERLKVTIHKPQAPIGGKFRDAAVSITRTN